jgi:hypothetical protein
MTQRYKNVVAKLMRGGYFYVTIDKIDEEVFFLHEVEQYPACNLCRFALNL